MSDSCDPVNEPHPFELAGNSHWAGLFNGGVESICHDRCEGQTTETRLNPLGVQASSADLKGQLPDPEQIIRLL